MTNSRKKNVIKNSFASFILKIVNMIMQFILRTVFIYYLGKEYAGVSTLFTDILNVLSLFDLGVTSALIYSLYKPLAENDAKKVSAIIDYNKRIFLVIGSLIILFGVMLTPFLKYIVKDIPNITEDIRLIFIIYVLSTASSYFLVYKSTLIVADQKLRVRSYINAVFMIIECIISIFLIIFLRSFIAYLIAHLFFVILNNLVTNYIANKLYKDILIYKKERLTKAEKRAITKNMFALGIYKVSGVLVFSADSIVISAFLGTKEVAIIGSYNLIINSIRTMIESVAESAKSSVGNLSIKATEKDQEDVFSTINFIAFWGGVFCSTCFIVLLKPFINNIWLNKSFSLSMKIISVLVLNFYISVMVYPVEVFRTANGLFIQGKYRPAAMAIINIILDIVLVKKMGILGVLLATTFSRLMTQVWFDPYLIYKFVFKSKVREYYKDYLKKLVQMLLICLLGYFLSEFINVNNIFLDFILRALIAIIISNLCLISFYKNDKIFVKIKSKIYGSFKIKLGETN